MSIKIGINGFGRIGRLVARVAVMDPEVELVAINSTSDAEGTARLFEYDSTHGIFKGDVSYEEGVLIVNGQRITLFSDRDPKNLKWGEVGADIVAISCPMLQTIGYMKDTTELLKAEGLRDRVFVTIGGASTNAGTAAEVGADAWTKDGNGCIEACNRYMASKQ